MPDVPEQLERYGEALDRSMREPPPFDGRLAPADDHRTVVESVPVTEVHDRSRVVAVASLMLLIVVGVATLVVIRSGDDSGIEKPAGRPKGEPVARLRIESPASIAYQSDLFTTVPGVNEIELGGEGTKNLVFDDPKLSSFQLEFPQGPTVGKVDLQAGRDYRIGSSIAGHRAVGQSAVIHVVYRRPPKSSPQAERLLADGSLGGTTWLVTKSGTHRRGSITAYVNGIPGGSLEVDKNTWTRPATTGAYTVLDVASYGESDPRRARPPVRVVSGFAPCATARVRVTFTDGTTAETSTRRMAAPFRFFALGIDPSAPVASLDAINAGGDVIAHATAVSNPWGQGGRDIPPLQATTPTASPNADGRCDQTVPSSSATGTPKGQPTRGRLPLVVQLPDGTPNWDEIPDFISTIGRDGNLVGYVPRRYLIEPSLEESSNPQPVYADDLTTLVGYMHSGRGFVPLGTDATNSAYDPGPVVFGSLTWATDLPIRRNGSSAMLVGWPTEL